jgi:hypothetical protein
VKKPKKKSSIRNLIAVHAWKRSGAGKHRDRKRERKLSGFPDEREG